MISVMKIIEHWPRPIVESKLSIIDWKDQYNTMSTQHKAIPNKTPMSFFKEKSTLKFMSNHNRS